MELRQLRYLLAVAEEGHMGRAASRVHISQPGLSQQLRKLESELGVSLFERHNGGVRLSVAGAAFLPFARNALRQIRDAREAVADLNQLIQGPVNVGTLQAINISLLPKAIARLIGIHPGVQVQARELAALDIELGVQKGQLDLGIAFLPVTQSPDSYDTEHLFEEELVLVVREDNKIADHSSLPLQELAGIPLALPPKRFQIRHIFNEAAEARNLTPQVSVEVDNLHSLLAVVRESKLGAILPAMAVKQESAGLKCVRLTDPVPSCSVGLIWRQHSFRNSATRALAEELRALAQQYSLSAPCACEATVVPCQCEPGPANDQTVSPT